MKHLPFTGLRIASPDIVILLCTHILLTSFAEPTTSDEFNSIDNGFKLFTEETSQTYDLAPELVPLSGWKIYFKGLFSQTLPVAHKPMNYALARYCNALFIYQFPIWRHQAI